MKEDYLWDKTGKDDEIQQLESSLAVFRHHPGPAPQLPSRAQEEVPNPIRKWSVFNLRLALAFSAITVTALGTWAFLQKGITDQHGVENVFVSLPAIDGPPAEQRETAEDSQPAGVMQDSPTKVRPLGVSRKSIRPVKAVKQEPVNKIRRPILTAQEIYAYNEVRRALSISGEKFRIVKETISGVEQARPSKGR